MIHKKRGQFYLIAAIIIVAVVIGMAGFTNYLVKTKDVKIYDLNKELRLESESVVNYGIIHKGEFEETLKDFTETYGEYIGADYDVYFVYGNKEGINALKYSQVPTGSVEIAGVRIGMTQGEVRPVDVEGQVGSVGIITEEQTYNFNLNEGENFFFVIQEPTQIQEIQPE